MRALLDGNVLIALWDVPTTHRTAAPANGSMTARAAAGPPAPLTQNGCVRIMSHHGYPNALPVPGVMERLREAAASTHHAFSPDDLSLLDERVADATRIHGPRPLTDLYRLALAVRHGGRFVTFDRTIAISAIRGAVGAAPARTLAVGPGPEGARPGQECSPHSFAKKSRIAAPSVSSSVLTWAMIEMWLWRGRRRNRGARPRAIAMRYSVSAP